MSLRCAGLSGPQLAEVTLVLACALQHGSDDQFLSQTLGAQLDLTSTPAVLLQECIARCGLESFSSTCRACPAVVEPTVRYLGLPRSIELA